MTNKPLRFAAALVFSAVAFASPKTYTVVIPKPLQVGANQLMPGSYKMAVEGDKAVFSLPNHTTMSVPVKVETAKSKYADTIIDSKDLGGAAHLSFIELGGSTMKVEFDQ